ncbi:MAG: hypothetical protein CMI36_10115 [Owenweeksia sp.]|nr:hypothetical protein [Owenweeksia sp.]
MSLVQFFRVLNRNLNLFLLCSIVLAVVVFFLTRNLPKEYQSETEVYTGIASGLNVASVENSALDFFATSNEYDNLINIIQSKQTLVEVGERLLYRHMMLDSADPRFISEENWGHFRYKMPHELKDSLLVPGSMNETLENIREYKQKNYDSYLVKLTFEDGGSPYSYKSIQRINVYRLQNSDLIKISYTWSDPGIVQSTLEILNDVFTDKMAQIKMGQSSDVIEYFQEQVKLASQRLQVAETKLKDFRIKNRIINYQEQTKSIATLKEMMEDEYQKELAVKAAAEASVQKLEKQLELNKEIIKFSDDILEKRKQLADIKFKIAQLEVYYKDARELEKLKNEAERLEASLNNTVEKRYQYGKTTEGVPLRDVLQEWLSYTLALDEANARLEVFETRKTYFRSVYDEFAPLGSEIARMEREIAVEERHYLELLHSMNMAMMRQQSETLATGGLVVTVPPSYPLQPQKSKSMLLVLVAAVIGFIVPFSIVIIMEFLDNTIRHPERAEELTGLKLLGAFPDLMEYSKNKNVDMVWLREKALGLMSQNTRLEMRNLGVSNKKPKFVVVFSTRENDGKVFITHELANELVSMNFKVLVISHKPDGREAFYDSASYEGGREFLKTRSFEDLIPAGYTPSVYDFVFITFQSVLTEQYPLDLTEKADMAFCVISAHRSWNKADRFAMKEFVNTLNVPPRLIVNGVDPDYMDAVLGDIKKSRSFLRRFMKMIFTLEFHSKGFRSRNK